MIGMKGEGIHPIARDECGSDYCVTIISDVISLCELDKTVLVARKYDRTSLGATVRSEINLGNEYCLVPPKSKRSTLCSHGKELLVCAPLLCLTT